MSILLPLDVSEKLLDEMLHSVASDLDLQYLVKPTVPILMVVINKHAG